LGFITGYDVGLDPGAGQFAMDKVRITGAGTPVAAAAAPPVPDEQRADVLFAKTLTPPTARSHATYCVAQANGDDANPGSEDRPWRTIQKAANVLLPGDTVLVKDGDYVEQGVPGVGGVHITRSGAPDAWITFKAYPGQHPRVTSATWGTFRLEECAYIEINGFDVSTQVIASEKKSEGSGISTNKCHHVRFLNNRLHDCGGGGIGTGFSDYITVEGNTVYNNAFTSIYDCSGISLWEIHDLDNQPGYHIIVRRNVCYRNENKFTTLYNGQLTDGNGIIIDYSRGTGAILIENNLCYDNGGRGIDVGHARNVLVRNNTVVGNQRTPYLNNVDLRAAFSSDVRFVNNIVVGRPGQRFSKNWKATNIRYEHNLFAGFADVARDELGEGNLIGPAPLFVNPSLTPGEGDFHLKPGSPAIGAGLAAETPEVDLEGRPRAAGGADLGAYAR
jgi:parallel beta-helix repeat protein